MDSLTISQILSHYRNFDRAFWATYSVDFDTLYFVLHNDIKPMMIDCYFHLVCDLRKLDESLMKVNSGEKRLNNLLNLQEYCTISVQPCEGAFHPKILFFTSQEELLFIVSSANATSSGILSNQDLIGVYHYHLDSDINKDEVTVLFQYIKSFKDWAEEAKYDLDTITERFPFLNDIVQSNNIITIPHEQSLIKRVSEQIKSHDGLKKIRIFSPFFDDDLKAVSEIYSLFKKPLEIYSPAEQCITTLKVELDKNIQFFSTQTLKKKNFHAKFYEFHFENYSIVYWGSANCSYSGLLSPTRNYEMLVKHQMTHKEVTEYWGSMDAAITQEITYVEAKDEKEDSSYASFDVFIFNPRISDDELIVSITLKAHFTGNLRVVCVDRKNQRILCDVIEQLHDRLRTSFEPDSVYLFLESNGQRASNYLFYNNSVAIDSRINGAISEPANIKPDGTKAAVSTVFSLFNFGEKVAPSRNSALGRQNNYFWNLPAFNSRRYTTSFFNSTSYIQNRIIQFKSSYDEDEETGITVKASRNIKTWDQEFLLTDKFFKDKVSKLIENIREIEKKKSISNLDAKQWENALLNLIQFVLQKLDKTETLKFEDIDSLVELSHDLANICVWVPLHLIKSDIDKESLELMRCMVDIYQVLAVFKYARFREFGSKNDFDKDYIDCKRWVGRSLYYKYLIGNEFTDFITISEHNSYTVENLISKLPGQKFSKMVSAALLSKSGDYYKELKECAKIYSMTRDASTEWLLLTEDLGTNRKYEDLLRSRTIPAKNPNLSLVIS